MLTVFIILLIFALLIGGSVGIIENEKRNQQDKEREERQTRMRLLDREEYEKSLTDLSSRLGECIMNENIGHWNEYSISTRVLIFEQSNTIIVKSKEYKFSDILGYSLVDDTTRETIATSEGATKTSTSSMIGRSIVGGVLTGGIGAVAGAVTAKKSTSANTTSHTVTNHKYTFYIYVNSLQEPTIILRIGGNASKAQRLSGVINAIIERNKA